MTVDNIFLTGANGFVGRYLTFAIRDGFPHATIRALGGAALNPSPHCATIDLLDAEAVDRAVAEASPDLIIHLAAQSSPAQSEIVADATWAVNLVGSTNLALAAARHVPGCTFLFASTSEVYGASFLKGPASETTPLAPLNAYAKSKALAESMLADVLPQSTRLIVARPFNHTGPGQRVEFVLPAFATQVARIENGLQQNRIAVGNLDVRRDFLDVRDVVDAYFALIQNAAALPARCTVNISSGRARSLRELLQILQQLSKVDFQVDEDPSLFRSVDLPVIMAEPRLLTALTGWSPKTPIERTLSNLLDWARARLRRAERDALEPLSYSARQTD